MKCKSIIFYIGAVLLLGAIGASVTLAGTKLGLFDFIPGCAEGSGCDLITNGPWGVVPWLNIPVSFVGLAWFSALFIGWVFGGSGVKKYRCMVLIGVLASFGFIGIMIAIGSFCKWCALAHVCNILFWVICLRCGTTSSPPPSDSQSTKQQYVPWVCFVFFVVFLQTFILIGNSIKEENKQKSDENVEKMGSGEVETSTLKLLGGGHRIGSVNAPIQVVMFTDYQCPDCRRIEGQLASIMKTRSDVSVVVKHFPLNFDCNDTIGKFKLHGNACWAARAAEAAAIVGGQEAWEKMHAWLFSQKGSFTDKDFAGSLTALGFNAQEVINVMMGDETLQTVRENCVDGKALGVYFTPMVFINGVEYLWYYGGGDTLQNIINVVARNIEDGRSNKVAPPTAKRKLVEDWRRGKRRVLPGAETLSWIGGGDIEFVVWGDYQAGLSKEIDEEIKKTIKANPGKISYTFRHFPVDETCNAGVSSMPTKYEGSCLLAKLVVAADALGGDDARWNMHNWLMSQGGVIPLDVAQRKAAEFTGVDNATLQAVLGGIDVNNQMRMDILAKNNVWRKSIPVLMVDDRFVPRWRGDGVTAQELFSQILQVVEEESTATKPDSE